MKRKSLIPLIIFCACSLFSCKKNDSVSTAVVPNKLKLYIEDNSQNPNNTIDTFAVTYDADNRITSLVSPVQKEIFTYSSSSFTTDLYINSALSIHEILFLNSQLYVDSTFQYNNTSDTTTEKYIYNGKLITSMTTYDYSSINGSQFDTHDDYVYDNNGNVITDTTTDEYGNLLITTSTYLSQTVSFSVAPYFLPLQAKNLISTLIETDGLGDTFASITFTYVFDSKGRVTKQTATDSVSGFIVVKEFVYD